MKKLRQVEDCKPSLFIIDATEGDIGNQIYIKKKIEDFNSLNWPVHLEKAHTAGELLEALHWGETSGYSGVIVQMPIAPTIAKKLEEYYGIKEIQIPPERDCDGLMYNTLVMPATVRGIIDYLDACGWSYNGRKAVVLGRSKIVGKPMMDALIDRGMWVSNVNSKTLIGPRNAALAQADLVVSATGRPHLISRHLCPNAVVIDVGISRGTDGKLTGDFKEELELCGPDGWATPVPGGVGLLTRLGLIKNCLYLERERIAK